MEQFIVSSNSALELKLGNYKLYDTILQLFMFFLFTYINCNLIQYIFLTVRKITDINDSNTTFYPDMTYQVFGNV